MRRPMLLGISTILLATAAGSIAAAVLMPSGPVSGLPATGSAETVRRFYDAANEVIATGDPAPIQTVVAPHFVDAEPLPGVASGREGLEAHLAALHLAEPELRLEVEELVAAGDRVVARVGVRDGSQAAAIGGSVVDQSAAWGAVESFRVAGGRIVERRSDTDDLVVVRPLAEASVAFAAPAPRVVTVERITLVPGARWDALPAGPRLGVVEAGVLQVERGDAEGGGAGSHAAALAAGESFVAAAGDRLGVTNLGAGEASLLAVIFSVPPVSSQAVARVEPLPSGVTAQTLGGGLATTLDVGSATVALGRATLGRDARLSLTSAGGPVLLAADAGELEMSAWGTAWVRRGEDGMSAWSAEATLPEGDGLLLHPDGLVVLRGGGTGAGKVVIVTVRQKSTAPSGSPTT